MIQVCLRAFPSYVIQVLLLKNLAVLRKDTYILLLFFQSIVAAC